MISRLQAKLARVAATQASPSQMLPRPQDTDAYIRPRLQDSIGDEWVATEPTLMSTQYAAGARRARAWCCVLMLLDNFPSTCRCRRARRRDD